MDEISVLRNGRGCEVKFRGETIFANKSLSRRKAMRVLERITVPAYWVDALRLAARRKRAKKAA